MRRNRSIIAYGIQSFEVNIRLSIDHTTKLYNSDLALPLLFQAASIRTLRSCLHSPCEPQLRPLDPADNLLYLQDPIHSNHK